MYSEIEVKSIDGTIQKHIIFDKGNGEYTSFPLQEDNPNYEAYMLWLEENSNGL